MAFRNDPDPISPVSKLLFAECYRHGIQSADPSGRRIKTACISGHEIFLVPFGGHTENYSVNFFFARCDRIRKLEPFCSDSGRETMLAEGSIAVEKTATKRGRKRKTRRLKNLVNFRANCGGPADRPFVDWSTMTQ